MCRRFSCGLSTADVALSISVSISLLVSFFIASSRRCLFFASLATLRQGEPAALNSSLTEPWTTSDAPTSFMLRSVVSEWELDLCVDEWSVGFLNCRLALFVVFCSVSQPHQAINFGNVQYCTNDGERASERVANRSELAKPASGYLFAVLFPPSLHCCRRSLLPQQAAQH